eukprot:TCALIF_05516-PA protein Name:"Similar to TARS Threonine--tRNA ligase, cytoplasmic (Bos taurus)" AED:0.24 eAED:0.24 QI:16/0.71/0.62/0.87/0.71/0.75/8/94/631
MVLKVPDVNSEAGRTFLNRHLASRSFISGYEASQNDSAVFKALKSEPPAKHYENLSRWYNHVRAIKRQDLPHAQEGLQMDNDSNVANAEQKKKKEKKAGTNSNVGEMNPPPAFIAARLELWDKLKKERDEWLASQPNEPIKVTLPDGKVLEGLSWKSTPYDIAALISKGLADSSVISKVNGELWDLDRPLEGDCQLQLLKFDDEEGQAVFWHSSAHILGEAMERVYGGHLCYGPPIESGFYYDMHSEEHTVTDSDFKVMDDLVKKIVKEKQPFERLEMKKEDLLKMFAYNEFKVRILNEKVKTPTTTVYRCGPLIDLCRGPHVRHTGKIKSMAVTKNSSAYWEGNAEAESLQRVYGISFPDPKQMKEWKAFQEEAAKRDHRKLGREQDLFFFHELSPGSCFFLPNGAHIYNKLMKFIREEYWKRGFQEVISPNIYNSKLWQTSGHWEHYADDMFRFDVEKEKFGLKPMNCPGHCLIFDHGIRSWKGEKQKPVIIHRAILGSVERQMAVLTENFGGKWPFWLSPRQVMIVPVGPPFNEYATEVKDRLRASGFCADTDVDDSNTMNKKVRNAQIAQYNFIFVLGEKERSNQTVNVRTRDNKVHGEFTILDVITKFRELSESRVLNSEEWGESK